MAIVRSLEPWAMAQVQQQFAVQPSQQAAAGASRQLVELRNQYPSTMDSLPVNSTIAIKAFLPRQPGISSFLPCGLYIMSTEMGRFSESGSYKALMPCRQLTCMFVLIVTLVWVARGQSATQYEEWITTFAGRKAGLVTLDRSGNIYVAGTGFDNVPITQNAFTPAPPSPLFPQGYVIEMDPTGSKVLYGTFLNGLDPIRIAVDAAGFIYVLADHTEPDIFAGAVSFPAAITPGAAQTTPGLVSTPVLLKIAPSGELVYGTYLGGLASRASGLAVDSRGAATICGWTWDPNLPVSANAYQQQLRDVTDAFVMKVSPDGSYFEALTYLGGTGRDFCLDLRLDELDNVYVYGDTGSRYFPVTQNAYQGTAKGLENLFVSKLDPSLTHLIWSTYIGSSGIDFAQSLNLAQDGCLLLMGTTQSPDFPVTPGTTPPYLEPGLLDSWFYGTINRPFFAILDQSGSGLRLSYVLPFEGSWEGTSDHGNPFYGVAWAKAASIAESQTLNAEEMPASIRSDLPYPLLVRFDLTTDHPTYVGFLRDIAFNLLAGIATDAMGNAVVFGTLPSSSYSLPGVPLRQLGQIDTYESVSVVVRFNFSSEKKPLITQVMNPASLMPSPTAPGQLIRIRGLGFGSADTTQVRVDGAPIPAVSVTSDSILAVAPASLINTTSFELVVERDGIASDARTVPVAVANPALFTAQDTGSGQALANNEDGRRNSSQQPAQKGRRLRVFATGLGAADTSGNPLSTIEAEVNGNPASVLAVASAIDFPAGCLAVDLEVPTGAPTADFVPVKIKIGGYASQPGVTVAIR